MTMSRLLAPALVLAIGLASAAVGGGPTSGTGLATDLTIELSQAPLTAIADERLHPWLCMSYGVAPDVPWQQRCGSVEVDRPDGSGNNLRLEVKIVSPDVIRNPIPLLRIGGGPALPNINGWQADPLSFPGAYAKREVIYFDARGTGLSSGGLSCPKLKLPEWGACLEALEPAGIDLTLFAGQSQARDIEALRVALGIEQWDVEGSSYGAEIAQHVLDLNPETVRSAVLSLPTAVQTVQPLSHYFETATVLMHAFEDCAAELYCAERHPEMEERFTAVTAELNDDPWVIPYGDEEFVVTGNLATWRLGTMLGEQLQADALDRFVDALELRASDLLGQVMSLPEAPPEGGWEQQSLDEQLRYYSNYARHGIETVATLCADGIAGSRGRIPPESMWFSVDHAAPLSFDFLWACTQLEVATPVTDTSQPITSEVPTLILSGRIDLRAPSTEAPLIAAGLLNSQTFELRWYGHGGMWEDPCPQFLQMQFWADPLARVDASCLGELTYENIYGEDCPEEPNPWVISNHCIPQPWDSIPS